MATKRKLDLEDEDGDMQQLHISNKKHTLDSDEEDSDDYEKDNNASDVEGEEDGESNIRDEVKITPFNMREEMSEGHFDVDGTYHWNKETDVKDNWLDNIDWVKVEKDKRAVDGENDGDSMQNPPESYNETQKYDEILAYMQPGETVQKTLQRLGKSRAKISSAERIRRKKLGIVDEAAEKITKFTELANEILTKTGNMDIYQETYDEIKAKQCKTTGTSSQGAKLDSGDFDMYADDFTDKEKNLIDTQKNKLDDQPVNSSKKLAWEFKWKQEDTKINGPHTTEQMLKWSEDNYFGSGVYVRKVGQESSFYTSNRIDFDLYL